MKSFSALLFWLTVILILSLSLVGCGSSEPSVSPTQNPLVAQYSVPTGQSGNLTVRFGTDTTYGRQTSAYPAGPGVAHVLVAGMKPSTTYHMQAQITDGGSVTWSDKDRVFTTGALPIPIPPITVTRTTDPALQATENPGVELISFFPATNGSPVIQTFVTDRDGNPIWYYAPPGSTQFMKLMSNGHMLVGLSYNSASLIREIDLAGNTIRELSASTLQQNLLNMGVTLNNMSFSHDFIPMANGHVIVLVQISQDFDNLAGFPGTTTVLGDALIDLDENWNPGWVWSAFDHLDVNRHPMFFPDWTHSNAIVYNPADGNLLISMRHQSWVLYLDYANGTGSGNILWRLGNEGDFTLPGNDPSQWFYAQHFPALLSTNGTQMTLGIFDNGDFRILDNQGDNCADLPYPTCYSRATIFQLDQSTLQTQLLWQNQTGYFSFWGGNINELPNGNVEYDMSEPFLQPATGALVTEVTQTATPQVVWQMELDGGFSYRTYRIPSLYPDVNWP
jgi:arylsulfate sulfotransferase